MRYWFAFLSFILCSCSDESYKNALESTFEDEFSKSVISLRQGSKRSYHLIRAAYIDRIDKVEFYYLKAEKANHEASIFHALVDTFLAQNRLSDSDLNMLIQEYREADSIIRACVPKPPHPRFVLDTLSFNPSNFTISSNRLIALMLSNQLAITENKVIDYLFHSIDVEHNFFSDHVTVTPMRDTLGEVVLRFESAPIQSFSNRETVIDSVFRNGKLVFPDIAVRDNRVFAEVGFGNPDPGTYIFTGHTILVARNGATHNARFSEQIEIKD